MLFLLYILLQAGATIDPTSFEKLGFLGCALLAIVVLWKKISVSENKYSALLERVINLENNSTKALERNNDILEHLTDLIEKKIH